MEQRSDIWIEHYEAIKLTEPIAIVGSPGLRSVGKLVVDSLISETKAQIIGVVW